MLLQTYQLCIVTVALWSSAPSPKPLKPCIEGFKRREGKHKRGVWGSRGHVDHVILHPHVIFEPAHVCFYIRAMGKVMDHRNHKDHQKMYCTNETETKFKKANKVPLSVMSDCWDQ